MTEAAPHGAAFSFSGKADKPDRLKEGDDTPSEGELIRIARALLVTQLFEAFAIKVILASRSQKDAGNLLGLGWNPLQSIMKRAVERGLERLGNEEVAWVGMDEESFRKGHHYISLLNDLEEVRVLDVVEGREG